jgi:hypothetical protein
MTGQEARRDRRGKENPLDSRETEVSPKLTRDCLIKKLTGYEDCVQSSQCYLWNHRRRECFIASFFIKGMFFFVNPSRPEDRDARNRRHEDGWKERGE